MNEQLDVHLIVGLSSSLDKRRNNTFKVNMNLRRSQRFCRMYGDGFSGLPSREVTPGANTLTLFLLYLNLCHLLLFSSDNY